MKASILTVYECEKGMKLADDVLNSFGAKIAVKDTVIDEIMIEKFMLNRVQKLLIYSNTIDSALVKEKRKIKKNYDESAIGLKELMKGIGQGKDAKLSDIQKIGEDFIDITLSSSVGNVFTCLKYIKEVDTYTYNHSINVSVLSMMIGRWLDFDEQKVKELAYAGMLHDIGKSKVPLEILNKPGRLTDEEFEEIKKHTVHGYRIIQQVGKLSDDIASGVLMHHERDDGKGYPVGLYESNIHEFAKIIGVADVYDAMTSKRVYHEPESPFRALEMFQNGSFGTLNTKILYTFLNNVANYYIGDTVKLSNGEEGKIAYINPFNISRPIVRIDNSFVDLSREYNVDINEIFYS